MISYTPLPPTHTTSLLIHNPHQMMHLLQLVNLRRHVITMQGPQFTSGLTVVLCILWVWTNV